MPITYTVLDDGTLVHTKVSGVLAEEDVLAHESALVNDPAVKPGFRELFDARQITGLEVTEETILEIARIDQENPAKMSRSKSAVVTADEEAFRWQRLFNPAESKTVIAFSNINTARTWLGIPEDED